MGEKQESEIIAEGAEAGKRRLRIIGSFFGVGQKLYNAAASSQPTEFLTQQAYLGFVKILMSLRAFLGFVSLDQNFAQKWNNVLDRSSPSVLARQVLEDILSFLYLCEPNVESKEKEFRATVWAYHGGREFVEACEFVSPSNSALPDLRSDRDQVAARVRSDPLLSDIKGPLKGYVRNGTKNRVVYDREILQRRGIEEKHYSGPHKMLSNFVHFSGFSSVLMTTPERAEAPFYTSILYLARFVAEALGAFVETFPESDRVLTKDEREHIAFLRRQLRI
jgi:hypothetical protein